MFPLEQAVVPGTVVPLHIFEPRYRALARAVTVREDPEFGIAMIERGREVGGGDHRSDIGVVARVLQAEELPDGRWVMAAVATRVVEVGEWLADDPFPRALVQDRPDTAPDVDPAELELLVADVDRILAAARRLAPDRPVPEPVWHRDDPSSLLWQVIGVAGLGPLDNQQLVRESECRRRLALARRLVGDRADLLEALLG